MLTLLPRKGKSGMIGFLSGPNPFRRGVASRGDVHIAVSGFISRMNRIYKWYNLDQEFYSSGCRDESFNIFARGRGPKLRARAIARSSP
jgi:hypothetical protein